jgi:hypothetical protein
MLNSSIDIDHTHSRALVRRLGDKLRAFAVRRRHSKIIGGGYRIALLVVLGIALYLRRERSNTDRRSTL